MKKEILIFCIYTVCPVFSQEKSIEMQLRYTSELQSNLLSEPQRSNWVNLLTLQTDVSTKALGGWKNGYINTEFISVFKTSAKRIAPDLQMFSNIEETNLPVGVFVLGYTQVMHTTSLFGGLRNVNRDYFTSRYTSLFTNSSCGIYPTLSLNYPLANYPLSAMSIHLEHCISNTLCLKSSLYNGKAYAIHEKAAAIFTVKPATNGMFSITDLNYTSNKTNYANYNLGVAVHSRYINTMEDGSKETKKVNYTLWANAEQTIFKHGNKASGIFVQASYAPPGRNNCHWYYAAGCVLSGYLSTKGTNSLGLVVNHAVLSGITETAVELTCHYPLSNAFSLQPAIHYIQTGKEKTLAAMLRFSYSLSYAK